DKETFLTSTPFPDPFSFPIPSYRPLPYPFPIDTSPPGGARSGWADRRRTPAWFPAHSTPCPLSLPLPVSSTTPSPPLPSTLPHHNLSPLASLHQAGLEAVFMGRVDQQEKETRLAAKTMEFMWRAEGPRQRDNQVLGMVSYDGYYSPPQFRYQDSDSSSYHIQ
ncbi:unnamed protein product, partial [Closterium sp. NIES-54]